MDIGKPKRIHTVEPIEEPVPQKRPEKRDEPTQPRTGAGKAREGSRLTGKP